MSAVLDLLARNPLFAVLQPSDRLALAQEAVGRRYEGGEPVVQCGDVWPYLLLVEEGRVAAAADAASGETFLLTMLEPGDLFWGQAFFREGAPMVVRLVASDASLLYLWPRDRLLPLLLENPPALWELARLVAGRLEWSGPILDAADFQPIAARLARLLLSRSARADDGRVSGDLTLAEMASWTRTTSDVVCRMLYRFSDQGLIRLVRAGLFVLDRDGLARMAQWG
ncbi:MAG TPA: Crp/Fnr family transcriptional regulator [Anaerolineae bacterium]|nr:Crp/Fnr family transcriptional regulator [Anaerolineae bacterium]HOQ97517.1 Crp/Fnr family transcriptional regulator [Anaerolineae bacterium]HPL28548.1 Crp/Fnr family transcriptional regulator [Anaerolineae bacterium]